MKKECRLDAALSLTAGFTPGPDDNSGLETSGWLGKVQHGNDARGRKTVQDSSVYRFSKADYEQFRKASSKIDEAWVKEMDSKGFKGQELLDGARALIEKYTKK